ncbi:hypothetical protein KSP39_PZI007736 [Platanthera zijinensis]|uniref:DUF1308 domain-containing protein n=1 Tax=Platanthera zijinensis TaxID=2320716 RepID=A0AAP0BNS0_9ASPA
MDPSIAQPFVSLKVEQAKRRCLTLQDEILNSLPPSKLAGAAKLTLLRLLRAELRFLLRLPSPSTPITSNIAYFESIVRVLLHPELTHASRLCKPVPSSSAHVDIVCTFRSSPSWFIVSARNPAGSRRTSGLLLSAAERTLLAARSAPITIRPDSVFLVFSRGVSDEAASTIRRHLGALEIDAEIENLEEGWIGVSSWVMEGSRWFEVKIESENHECRDEFPISASAKDEEDEVNLGKNAFCDLIACLRLGRDDKVDLINFDTTALIAMVSGISNGHSERLLRAPEGEMRQRFKGNYMFVIAQVTSELEQPILIELKVVLEGKKGIICESVHSEFKELISMCGGANEKLRAARLLKHLLIVRDSPSARICGLPTTRKIAEKNKIIFGTGDHWHAPTLTANMGFVRAIAQTGMSLLTIEHRPRALTGF